MQIVRPYEYKLLLPQKRQEWRTPSLAQPKTVFGHENHQFWRLTARLSDGHIVWRGRFDDREDADAFLDALGRHIVLGSPMPRELWELPTPAWFPGLGEGLSYDFASPIIITSGTSQTSPSDWNNSSNTVEGLGGGASGAAHRQGTQVATGGGGAEYREISNFSVATPGTTAFNYTIGPGGTAVTATSGSPAVNGNDGTQTTFNTTSLVAQPGIHGVQGTNPQSGGAGGTGGTGAAANFDGGRGGNSGSFTAVATGGGGAAGPAAAGSNGVDGTVGTSQTNGGNSGDGATGGASATGVASPGANGTAWDASHGAGAGGGGARSGANPANITGGSGGNYGGGGGAGLNSSGAASTNPVSGAGIQGIIVLTYTPAVSAVYGYNDLWDMPPRPSRTVGYWHGH